MSTSVLPRGRSTKLRMQLETTYATPPTGNWSEVNSYSLDLNRVRALEADDVLGAGFANTVDARPAAPNVEDATGKLTVPFDLHQAGFWLGAALGLDVVTGSGPYTHVWTSGLTQLPSFSLEREFVAAAQYDGMNGGVVKSLKLPFKPGKGYNMIDVDIVGAKVLEPYAATVAGTPMVQAIGLRIPNTVGVIKIAGSQVGQIIDGSLTITNDITLDRYVGSSAFVSAAFLEGLDISVDLTARYNTDALRAYGTLSGSLGVPSVQTVEVDYVVGANSLTLVLNAVRFEPINAPVANGKTITLSIKGRAEVGASAAMLTATLVNNVASGAYG